MLTFVDLITTTISGPVLDVPCGNGRNALPFAERGIEVYCLDKDTSFLKGIAKLARNKKYDGRLIPIEANLNHFSKRFRDKRFGAVLNIHYIDLRLISWWKEILLPGGYVFLETFDNRGSNYEELPVNGAVLRLLGPEFEILHSVEKPAGPPKLRRATMLLLARRKQ